METTPPSAGTRSVAQGADVRMGKTDESKLESSPIGGTAHVAKEGLSVIDIVKMEHAAVKQLYTEYKGASSGEVKEAKAFLILNQIVQHSGKEEIALYPIIRKKLPDGNALIDRSTEEHQVVTKDLNDLDKLTFAQSPAEFERIVHKTMADLEKHVLEEENEILPKLAEKCSTQELIDIGKQFQSAVVTTRPHTMAPREGMPAAAAHMASVPLDAARDAARFTEATKEAALKK